MKKVNIILSIFFVFGIIITTGCSKDNKIAYITIDDEYENTFKELEIGEILNFNIKLSNADKNWVSLWLEGYSHGKKVEPFPLEQLNYGLSPNQDQEGMIGLGIINTADDKVLFLYAPDVTMLPRLANGVIKEEGISGWDYTFDNKTTIGLNYGETKLLGIYRQNKNSLRTYDYQDEKSIKQIINEDETVLLLKIKIEEKKEK